MNFFENLKKRAFQEPKAVVIPEIGLEQGLYLDEKNALQEAIRQANREGTAKIIELTEEKIKNFKEIEEFTQEYIKLRNQKGRSPNKDNVEKLMTNPIIFATMMVKLGYADGMLAGKYKTKAEIIPHIKGIIGEKEGEVGSGIFFIEAPKDYPVFDLLAVADIAAIQEPDAEQLYRLIVTSAKTFEDLAGEAPRIVLPSHVTGKPLSIQSNYSELRKIEDALKEYEKRGHPWPIYQAQADAALNPSIAKQKKAEPFINKQANLWIRSNIQLSNTIYKLLKELTINGDSAIITQGLNHPVMLLSRGDSSSDIANVIAACSVQAQILEKQKDYRPSNPYFLK